MNYMVIGTCTIIFLLIANSLLVFLRKISFIFRFYYIMFFKSKVTEKETCTFKFNKNHI